MDFFEEDLSKNAEVKISFPERISRFIADNPWKFLISSLVIATVFSSVGIVGGEFSVSVDNKGWNSRGTLIANREVQLVVIRRNRRNLFNDEDGSVWNDLETNIKEGWKEKIEQVERRRRLNELPLFEGCDTEFYYSEDENVLSLDNVYAVWKTQPDDETTSVSTLDANVIKQICEADVKTLAALEANNACKASCGENKCLPGHSLSLVLHVYLELNELSCDALVEAYTSEVEEKFVAELADCSNEIRDDSFDPVTKSWGDAESCPELFRPSLLSSDFGLDGNQVNRYSTTYYDTYKTLDAAYEAHDDFDFGDGDLVEGAYGTLWDYFTDVYVDILLTYDMVSEV